ncbi:hypothetical protein EMCRGX_G026952 [Ephydatia muelleri]
MRMCECTDRLLYVSLMCIWVFHAAQTFSPDLICLTIPSLNAQQKALCRQLPKAMNVLVNATLAYTDECNWQFRKDRWNCSVGGIPIFASKIAFNRSREAAFTYALVSAITAHSITSACANSLLGSACGCDTSMSALTQLGWDWGGCSHDVNYGVQYAQSFLDARETTNQTTDIGTALVNLHNNAVGRQTVQDYMQTSCSCHGISGSCTVQTCWRQLPEVGAIGDVLRQKYEAAAMVRVDIPRDGSPASLYYTDSMQNPVAPSSTEMVYLEPTVDYCSQQSNYTLNRYCIPRSNMTSYLGGYYSTCEDLCCNGQYVTVKTIRTYSCNCKFIWCCNVVCSTCTETMVQYKCTS